MGSTSSSQSIQIVNTGTAPAAFSSIALTGTNASEFTIASNSCGTSLAVSSACTLLITFSPTATGGQTAAVTLTDNATGSPQTVTLNGTGQPVTTTITVTPTSLTFPATNTGITSASQYIQIVNTGTVPATFSSTTITGTNASEFAFVSNSCGTSLAVGNSCLVYISFTPAAVGTRTATVTFTDNATTSPQTVSLSGTGQPPSTGLSITPNLLTFAGQNVSSTSASQYVSITNSGNTAVSFTSIALTGTNASDFAVTSNSCGSSLAAGATCYVYIDFTPSAIGSRTAALTLTDNAPNSPQSVSLTGTGQTTTTLTFNPASLSFTAGNVGVPVTAPLTITNTGAVPAFFSSFAISGTNASDFSITANSCPTGSSSLAAGNNCTLTVTLTPSAAGPRSGNLTVTDNAANSPQVIFLSGNGASINQTLAFQYLLYPFDNQNIGSTSSQVAMYVTNTGNTTVNLTSIAVTGANAGDYAISANQCASSSGNVLTPNASCYVYLTFSPTAAGIRNAFLTYTDSASGSPQSVVLTGNGVTPAAAAYLQLNEISYAAQNVGTTSAQQYTYIYNSGTTPLLISSIAITGTNASDFAISTNQCASSYTDTIPVGGNCYVYVTFTPTATGNRTAFLTFTDNAPSSPQNTLLSGIGQASTQILTSQYPALSYSGQYVGTTSTAEYVYFQNNGTAPITISSITITGTNAADYSITSNQCSTSYSYSLTVGQQCYVYVAFSPSAAGTRTAAITVASNASGSPLNVPLNGLGLTNGMNISVFPSTLTFSQPVGLASAAKTVTILNTGAQAVSFSSIAITGPSDYAITANTCPASSSTLASGSSCTVQITYTPSAVGTTSASLGITSGAGTQAVGLSGSGQSPAQTLSVPTSANFGTQNVSVTSLAQAITIQNTGNESVTFTSFAIAGTNSGDFAIGANSCGTSLAAGATCTVGVTFTPAVSGSRSGTLVVTDSATASPQSVALSGTGGSAATTLNLSTQVLDFGTLNVGATSSNSYYVYVTNTGGASITFSSYTITGANASEFAISTNQCTSSYSNVLTVGNYCYVYVSFTPTAPGLRTATLQFADNASGSPQSVTLTGVGLAATQLLTTSVHSLSFPVTNVSATATALAFYVTNAGNASVTFSSYTFTGANAGDFTISQNNCAGTNVLTAGTSCYIYVTFTPSATGVRNASLQIADNASNSPQSVSLVGPGQAATQTLSFSPVSFDFGVHNLSTSTQSAPLYATNSGTAAVSFSGYAITGTNASDFTITTNQCSSSYSGVLTKGNYCYLYVTFTPSAAGIRSAALTFTDSATGSPQSIPLTGTGQAATQSLTLTFNSYDYGAINVGTTSSVATEYIYNRGTGTVTFSGYALSGTNASDFTITTNQCSSSYSNALTTGNYCYVQISFTPSAAGTRTATLTLTDNATGSPQTVQLAGTGQAVTKTLQPSPLDLVYSANVGATASVKYVYFTNTGTGPITFSGGTISGTNASDFAISTNQCVSSYSASGLPSGSYCYVGVTFTPSAAGSESATLTVTNTSSGSPQTINLVGLGQSVNKIIELSNDYILYGTYAVGSSNQTYVYLYSKSTGSVTPSTIVINGPNASDFSLSTSSTCAVGTAITSSCYIYVKFTPTAPGLRVANLQITDDAVGATQNVSLVGGAYVSGATLVPYSTTYIDFGRIPVNTTSSQSILYLQNSSASAVSIGSPTIVGANVSDFSIVSTTCGATLAASATCYSYVKFTPSATGPRNAALQVSYTGGTGTSLNLPLAGDGNGGSGYIGVDPVGLEFDDTNVNSTAAYQTITLTNTSQSTVNFSGGFSFAGTNASDFSIYSNGCTSALAPTAACNVYVQFTPSATGLRTATLQIADDASNTPQSISLVGTATTASQSLYTSTPYLDFGAQDVNGGTNNASISLRSDGTATIHLSSIQITGTNASDYTFYANNCGTNVAFNSSCSITIQFAPSTVGISSANLVVTGAFTGSPLTIPLSGVGQPDTMIVSLNHVSLDFGVENIGAQSTLTVTVSNDGDEPVSFTQPSITGANASDFVIASNACGANLAAGSSCNVTVGFTPSASGARTATLQINDNASGSPQTVLLAGTGQIVSHLLSANTTTLDFDVLNIGTISPVNSDYVAISNTGTDAVTISGISISGANASDFQITNTSNCATNLAAAGTCYVYVQFRPSVAGPEGATLTVTSNASNSPLIVALVGEGQTVTSGLIQSVAALDLGNSAIGTTTTYKGVTVTNSGTAPVSFFPPTFTGVNAANFVVYSNGCTGSLAVGSNCTVYVEFTPTAAGTSTATLNINSTASGSPVLVSLTGNGTAASGAVLNFTNPVKFLNTTVASSNNQYAFVFNIGTASATVSSVVVGGANAGDFSINSNTCATVAPAANSYSCYVYVKFTPVATGARTANLVFTDTAPGSPHTVVLTGTGQ